MHSRYALTLRLLAIALVPTLALLAFRASAQAQGGGSGGGWMIDYDAEGKTLINGSPNHKWGRQDTDGPGYPWFQSASGDSEASAAGPIPGITNTGESSGTFNVRLSWTGSGTPAPVWFAVESKAYWDTPNGTGTAADGYGDQSSSGPTHGESSGVRVYRVSSLSTTKSVAGAKATVTLVNPSGMPANDATCFARGFLTDKNATLARTDGGGMSTVDDVYTAHTLLSWDDSGGTAPGLTTQTATGTYGGTWTKVAGSQDDNVNVTWSGADYSGAPVDGEGFAPPGDHHTTSYPPSPGKMPMADLSSCSPKTQDWTYQVRDNLDRTQLNLKLHWICHFAFENFVERPTLPDPYVVRTAPHVAYTARLSSDNPTAQIQVLAGQIPATTTFDSNATALIPSNGLIPGFPPQAKHVGIPAFQTRAGHTKPNNWSDYTLNVSFNSSYGPGEYGVE